MKCASYKFAYVMMFMGHVYYIMHNTPMRPDNEIISSTSSFSQLCLAIDVLQFKHTAPFI